MKGPDLKPGDAHYRAYVGPVDRYDFMGATQFRLLCALGLRMNHVLLDFGCGSLRAGKLFIPYLEAGHYYGVEPNRWLIEEGIKREVGHDLIRIKQPHFSHNSDFSAGPFSTPFDFILAQSIFSHTGGALITTTLRNFREALKDDGLIVATFIEGVSDFEGEGWVYPHVVTFRPVTLERFAREAGLVALYIPWYHPGQSWYILAKRESRLPSRSMFHHLLGAVLFDPQFEESVRGKRSIRGTTSGPSRFEGSPSYKALDTAYIALDKAHVLRTANIDHIPGEENRKGGKYAYAEWAHVIGIFQTLMGIHLDKKENNEVLDVGCGTGLLAIASEPFLGDTGRYVGMDVNKNDIAFCRRHYRAPWFSFVHLDAANAAYVRHQKGNKVRWDFEEGRFDLVTALSVWTHLGEEEALYYFTEIDRVLKPGGIALATFFLLDAVYEEGLPRRSHERGRYHMLPQDRWIFDQPAYGSAAWFHPAWATVPEQAVGVTPEGMRRLLSNTALETVTEYLGSWKEMPGAYFQDVLVFRKARRRV